MYQHVQQIGRSISQFRPFRFALIGALGALVNLATFKVLIWSGFVSVLWAPIPAFAVAVTHNYFMNARLTFHTPRSCVLRIDRYLLYVLGNVLGLVVNLAVYYPGLLLLQMLPIVAQALGILAGAAFDYFVARRLLRNTR